MNPKARLNEEARSTEGKLPKRVVSLTAEERRRAKVGSVIEAAIRMLCPTDG